MTYEICARESGDVIEEAETMAEADNLAEALEDVCAHIANDDEED